MPITDINKFMFLPNTRNAIHKALLVADPRARKIVVLDHKTYTMLSPGSIQVFLYMKWLTTDTAADRLATYQKLCGVLDEVAGLGMVKTLSLIEDFDGEYSE